MNTTWREALQNRYFVYGLVLVGLSLLGLILFLPYFFNEVIAGKEAIVLNDFVLDQLAPVDYSWTIFTLIYSCLILTAVTHYKKPSVMVRGLATFSLVQWLRLLTIYLFTLDAPNEIIFLMDPFLSAIVYPKDFVKDLFFSGHISTLVVFILVEDNAVLRWLKIVATIVVAALLLVQHVHYTLDVVAAPFFTYGVYRLVNLIQKASEKLR